MATVARMESLAELLASYDYPLAKSDIAEVPASPRDSAKLLVYDRAAGTTTVDSFLHLDKHLPPRALLIFNDTKVVPARLPVRTPTGGLVELLCIRSDAHTRLIECLSPRTLAIGTELTVGPDRLTVESKDGSVYRMRLHGTIPLARLLTRYGETPIPPYLKHTPLSEHDLRDKYQTIFAKHAGSSAAPTASLHFTKRLLAKLARAKIETAYVTLHVGLGTFAPLTETNIESGTLHHEEYSIPPQTVRKILAAKKAGRPVIAVGTTAARALESAFAPGGEDFFDGLGHSSSKKGFAPGSETNLFIREGYRWRIVDGLITNFHVPQSSLLMLVATLVGRERLFSLYAFAKQQGFRFLSFGDGMLVR